MRRGSDGLNIRKGGGIIRQAELPGAAKRSDFGIERVSLWGVGGNSAGLAIVYGWNLDIERSRLE